jgi:membrane protein DedA with SNARE-associated domain
LGVFLGVLIEAIIVPIPSPLIVMFAGFVLIQPGLSLLPALARIFLVIVLPASAAGLIGNYVVYWIAYFGGKPLIQKLEKYLGFSWGDVLHIRKKFGLAKSEGLSIALLRAIPIMPLSLISGAAGVFKLDWKKFGISSLAGMLFRNMFSHTGWQVGNLFLDSRENDNLESFLTISLLALLALIILAHKLKIWRK